MAFRNGGRQATASPGFHIHVASTDVAPRHNARPIDITTMHRCNYISKVSRDALMAEAITMASVNGHPVGARVLSNPPDNFCKCSLGLRPTPSPPPLQRILRFLGFAAGVGEQAPLLITEYMPRGSVHQLLVRVVGWGSALASTRERMRTRGAQTQRHCSTPVD